MYLGLPFVSFMFFLHLIRQKTFEDNGNCFYNSDVLPAIQTTVIKALN